MRVGLYATAVLCRSFRLFVCHTQAGEEAAMTGAAPAASTTIRSRRVVASMAGVVVAVATGEGVVEPRCSFIFCNSSRDAYMACMQH